MVVDPVCKMSLSPEAAAATMDYAGNTYYFCSRSCHARFAADPGRYREAQAQAPPEAESRRQPACAVHAGSMPSHPQRASLVLATGFGAFAAAVLSGFYFATLTLVSGWAFTVEQFSQYWYFVIALTTGFGVQVGLYMYLRRAVNVAPGSGKVVAVSGTTSGAAMVSCCAHYLVNLLPVLGATGVVALVAQYQVEFFWVGLAFNLAGMLYVGSKVIEASRHMASMARHGHEA